VPQGITQAQDCHRDDNQGDKINKCIHSWLLMKAPENKQTRSCESSRGSKGGASSSGLVILHTARVYVSASQEGHLIITRD
jgi:hypothetical protein